VRSSFYSLSRDGDSGTQQRGSGRKAVADQFLFAVARWGQRNRPERHVVAVSVFVSIRCREMGTAEQQRRSGPHPDDQFLFAVARWGQRNRGRWRHVGSGSRVSIRCREMGTAELGTTRILIRRSGGFLFAVARWGQRNSRIVVEHRILGSFYSLSRDGDSGTLPAAGARCRLQEFIFAVARWGQRNCRFVRLHRKAPQSFYSLSRDGDSGT